MTSELPNYKKVSDDELASLLQAGSGSKELAANFWRAFTDYPVKLLGEGNPSQATAFLIHLLRKCQAVDALHFNEIDKGIPYDWLGMAMFLNHDYQTATFFLDGAVAEDLRWGADPEKAPTPAMLFITLEGIQPLQSAQKLVQAAEAKIQRSLEFYKSLSGKPSYLPDCSLLRLRLKLLRPALQKENPGWLVLAINFISLFLEKGYRDEIFELRPGGGTFEPFYRHLFKGCVLFADLLKENLKKKPAADTLEGALAELHVELGISSILNPVGAFQDLLGDLTSADQRIETAISYTLSLQHSIGGHLNWNLPMTQAQYLRLFEMVASACLHAVACLY
jgi:hypothetical protein